MAGHDAPLRMTQGSIDSGQLSRSCLPSELQHRFGQAKHRTRIARMTVRQHAAMGIERFMPPRLADATGQPVTPLTFCAKTQVFNLYQQRGCKAVIKLQ